jgi:hypothetical protein
LLKITFFYVLNLVTLIAKKKDENVRKAKSRV